MLRHVDSECQYYSATAQWDEVHTHMHETNGLHMLVNWRTWAEDRLNADSGH